MFGLKSFRWFFIFFLAFGLILVACNGNNGSTETEDSVSEVTTTVFSEENADEPIAENTVVTTVESGSYFVGEEIDPAADETSESAETAEADSSSNAEDVVYPVTITNTNQVSMTWGSEVMVVIFDSADEAGNWFAVIDGDQSITEAVAVDYTFEHLAVAYVLPSEEWGTNEGMDILWACALEEVQGGDFVACLDVKETEIGEAESDLAVEEIIPAAEVVCQFAGTTAAFLLISEGGQGSTNYVYTDPFWGEITIDSDHPVTMEEATMEDGCLKTGFSIPNFSGPMSLHVLASDGSDLPLYSFHNPTSQDGLGTDGHAFTAP